jgi:biopolymer transport protein ExbD/biopolymer transport protein TolR
MAFQPRGRAGTAMSEINVTPLVDVVLVLLIIFMVAAPMLQQGMEVALPQTVTRSEVIEEDRVILTLNRQNTLYLDDRPVNVNLLEETLRRILEAGPRPVFLRADREVKYGIVAAVMDAAQRAGVDQVLLVTEPVAEEPAKP